MLKLLTTAVCSLIIGISCYSSIRKAPTDAASTFWAVLGAIMCAVGIVLAMQALLMANLLQKTQMPLPTFDGR